MTVPGNADAALAPVKIEKISGRKARPPNFRGREDPSRRPSVLRTPFSSTGVVSPVCRSDFRFPGGGNVPHTAETDFPVLYAGGTDAVGRKDDRTRWQLSKAGTDRGWSVGRDIRTRDAVRPDTGNRCREMPSKDGTERTRRFRRPSSRRNRFPGLPVLRTDRREKGFGCLRKAGRRMLRKRPERHFLHGRAFVPDERLRFRVCLIY